MKKIAVVRFKLQNFTVQVEMVIVGRIIQLKKGNIIYVANAVINRRFSIGFHIGIVLYFPNEE